MSSRGMNGGHVVLAVLLLSGVLASASDDSSLSKLSILRGSRHILGTPDLAATTEEDITDIEQAKESELQELSRRMLGRTLAYGGNGGAPFDDRIHSRIFSLSIKCGDSLDSITVFYTDGKFGSYGGPGGQSKLTTGPGFLDFDPSLRVTIEVYTGPKRDRNDKLDNIVRGMRFFQNKLNFLGATQTIMVLDCGRTAGMTKFVPVTNRFLKGFHGRGGKYIDQIGFYY